jgi:hypothetical protein
MKPLSYVGEVVENDDGETCVELPVDMLNQMGWDEGTLLEWLLTEDDRTVILKESDKCQKQQDLETQ